MSVLSRWRDRQAYARIGTPQIEKLRDRAAEQGLDASREHYEAILADRSGRMSRRTRGRSR